jgi:ABC-type transporter Mla MlaB component
MNWARTSNFSDAKDNPMPFDLQAGSNEVTLILLGRLGVQQARPLWQALQPALDGKQTIHLQAEGLEEIDTSILQILCRLSRSAHLQIGKPSDRFLDALKSRGLEAFFVRQPAKSEPQIP